MTLQGQLLKQVKKIATLTKTDTVCVVFVPCGLLCRDAVSGLALVGVMGRDFMSPQTPHATETDTLNIY